MTRKGQGRGDGRSESPNGRQLIGLLALLLLLGAGPALAEPVTVAEERRPFRLDLTSDARPGGAQLGGYVYNDYDSSTSRVILLVEGVGVGGDVAGRTVVHVYGEIPGRSRTYVNVDVPAAPSYRVRVLSFDFTHCRD